MQRVRQALGTITNSNLNGPVVYSSVNKPIAPALNDENAKAGSVGKEATAASAMCVDYDFIEQQLRDTENMPVKVNATEKVTIVVPETKSVRFNIAKSDGDEDFLFKSEIDEDDDEDEEEETETSEEDEDEEEEEVSDNDEDDEDEEYEQGGDHAEPEEEGISRLATAANVSALDFMMDSYTSAGTASPMVLDDTIKFISKLEVVSDEAEQNYYFEEDDEEDEQTKRKQMAENVLLNLIDYKDDCMKYMRKLEQEYRPKPNYIKKQADITSSMRSILVDWLVEVAEEYKLNTETLHLAVNYTDRFLSQMAVLRSKLQLVGTSCMYIAAKYEEITPPDVSEFVYITDETYTKKQVLRMEHLLLKTLDFRVSQPTANWFLTHYLKFMKLGTNLAHGNQSDMFQRIECLARYLAELTLLDCETFLVYLPSQIAASAVYLSLLTLNKPWTKQIAELVGYNHDLSELKSCIADMFKLYEQAATLPQQAIQDKYKQAKYEHISLVDPPKSLPFEIPTKQNENEA